MDLPNICHFIPRRDHNESFQTLHFVLETKPQSEDTPRELSYYRLHFVSEGKGVLKVGGVEYPLEKGDMFFGLPAVAYTLRSIENFKFYFISFLGLRANYLIDKFRISAKNCVFRGYTEQLDFWKNALEVDADSVELRSESVLLYAFSSIGTKYYPSAPKSKKETTADAVKKYIDAHLSDPQLSLQSISRQLSYNPKYLSSAFKNAFRLGVSEYITLSRIQNACTLMEQGMTSVKNIAFLCGFEDPLYFSKVFKARMGVSPREHLAKL